MENKEPVYLIGASGHGKVILEIIEEENRTVAGLFDSNPEKKELSGYPVIGNLQQGEYPQNARFIISIGNNKTRKDHTERFDLLYTTAVHPKAAISRRCDVGKGTVIMAGVSVNSDSSIGKHVILNTNCSVDHDCIIEDFVHISPNACLAGNVTVGEGTHVGAGAVIIQGVNVGRWATIGAGAVVLKDVEDHAIVVGNPAKVIRHNH